MNSSRSPGGIMHQAADFQSRLSANLFFDSKYNIVFFIYTVKDTKIREMKWYVFLRNMAEELSFSLPSESMVQTVASHHNSNLFLHYWRKSFAKKHWEGIHTPKLSSWLTKRISWIYTKLVWEALNKMYLNNCFALLIFLHFISLAGKSDDRHQKRYFMTRLMLVKIAEYVEYNLNNCCIHSKNGIHQNQIFDFSQFLSQLCFLLWMYVFFCILYKQV